MRNSILLLLGWSVAATTQAATREEITFASHGVSLSGTLVIPDQPRAAVAFVHGSGKQTRNLHLAERFAAAGIAALVYDKRGAGRSGGKYEGDQSVSEGNLRLLADDARAAVRILSRHPKLTGVRTGLAGISQAGWIAPLAAERSPEVKFLVLWSGPVCRVSEEDIYSKYTDDVGSEAPPYEQALKARREKYVWPDFLGKDTDSADTLRTLTIPGLWIFSDNDASVPVDLSMTRLRGLRRAGHRYDYVLFSGLGHDNLDATFDLAANWIRRQK